MISTRSSYFHVVLKMMVIKMKDTQNVEDLTHSRKILDLKVPYKF